MNTLPPVPTALQTLQMPDDIRREVEQFFDQEITGDTGCRIRRCDTEAELIEEASKTLLQTAGLSGPTRDLSPDEWRLFRRFFEPDPSCVSQLWELFANTPSNRVHKRLGSVEEATRDRNSGRALVIKEILLEGRANANPKDLSVFEPDEIKAVAAQILKGESDDELTRRHTNTRCQAVSDGLQQEERIIAAHADARIAALYALASSRADDTLLFKTLTTYQKGGDPLAKQIRPKLEGVMDYLKGETFSRLDRLVVESPTTPREKWEGHIVEIVRTLVFYLVLEDDHLVERFTTDHPNLNRLEAAAREVVDFYSGDLLRGERLEETLQEEVDDKGRRGIYIGPSLTERLLDAVLDNYYDDGSLFRQRGKMTPKPTPPQPIPGSPRKSYPSFPHRPLRDDSETAPG